MDITNLKVQNSTQKMWYTSSKVIKASQVGKWKVLCSLCHRLASTVNNLWFTHIWSICVTHLKPMLARVVVSSSVRYWKTCYPTTLGALIRRAGNNIYNTRHANISNTSKNWSKCKNSVKKLLQNRLCDISCYMQAIQNTDSISCDIFYVPVWYIFVVRYFVLVCVTNGYVP